MRERQRQSQREREREVKKYGIRKVASKGERRKKRRRRGEIVRSDTDDGALVQWFRKRYKQRNSKEANEEQGGSIVRKGEN